MLCSNIVATAETAAVNTTDTDTITATENLSQHQTDTANAAISDPILVALNMPGDSRSTTGVRPLTDERVMNDDSSTVANVSPTVGVVQLTLFQETLLSVWRICEVRRISTTSTV